MGYLDNLFRLTDKSVADKAVADAKARIEKEKQYKKVGLLDWYSSVTGKPPIQGSFDHIDYPIKKAELPKSITDEIQQRLDNVNKKYPQVTSFVGDRIRQTNETLKKIEDFLTNKETPIGWVGGYPKRVGTAMADQAIGGIEQLKSQKPSTIPFTNTKVNANVAGVGKIVTSPLAAFGMGSMLAGDTAEALTKPIFGKDSLIPPMIGLGVAFAVPGNEAKDIQRAESLLQKLETGGGKLTKVQKEFRS